MQTFKATHSSTNLAVISSVLDHFESFRSFKKSSNAVCDGPLPASASAAFNFANASLSLSFLPSSDSSTSLTFFATSPAVTSSSSYPSITTPAFISSTTNTLFSLCSAYCGQHSIGTPADAASRTEFHPQCVMNAPVAACRSTSTCGAHIFSTIPLPRVLSVNPSGRSASRSGSGRGRKNLAGSMGGLRTTHRKRCPVFSSPWAIAFSCAADTAPRLPKQTNTTLRSGCASSHDRHACRSPSAAAPFTISGPMQCTGGVGRSGTHTPSLSALTALASSHS
uniref:Uncharacterized protein n=1 Tax=Avena sativa TaxID=4498 RepID=A0ACD5U1G2_AVESA